MKKKKIILAGENRLFTDALRVVLGSGDDFDAVVLKGTDAALLCGIIAAKPDLFVLHERYAGAAVVQTLREARRRAKDMGILFVIKESTPELFSFAGESAGVGIMPESADIAEFREAVFSLLRGERYISRAVLSASAPAEERARREEPLSEVTQREREVLYWLAKGLTNREISKRMILSEKTIKNHVSHILKKLDISDRTKAAAIAWEEGLPLVEEEFFSVSSLRAVIK